MHQSVEATLQVHGKDSFVGGTLCSNLEKKDWRGKRRGEGKDEKEYTTKETSLNKPLHTFDK